MNVDVKITDLPLATAIDGTESLELVQGGISKQGKSNQFPLPTYGYLLINNQPELTNSRRVIAGTGITLVDSGPGGSLTIVATGTVAGPANPAATIGLSAVNGSAITYMRSDAAPALSQAIVPTWTGAHTFSVAPRPLNNTIDLGLTGTRWGTIYGTDLALTNPVSAINGGTGQAVYVIGDLLYASTTTALSRLADVAAGSYLRSGGVGAIPTWATVASLGANPAASIGLSAVNGSASTYLRSDGAPALSQAIVPTWTGIHTWSSPAATFSVPVIFTGTTTAGNVVAWNSTGSNAFIGIESSTGGAESVGSSAYSLNLGTSNATSLWLSTNGIARIGTTSAGNVTINAPGSGQALTVTGSGATTSAVTINTPTAGIYSITHSAAAATTDYSVDRWIGSVVTGYVGIGNSATSNAAFANSLAVGTQTAHTLNLNTNDLARVAIGASGNVLINVPSSGDTLTVAPSVTSGALMASSSALTTGAGASAGTITNAPSAGNPTKWIKINDSGTIRSIPAW